MVFQSERLSYRLVDDGDFPHLFRLQSDPETMRYIRPVETEEAPVRERMAAWKKYAEENPGYGVWAMESLDRQYFIGYSVLRHVEFQPGNDIEVGYTVAKEHAGQGYATETTLSLMKYARDVMGVVKIVAFTDPRNHPSNRVLEKCGFVRTGMVPMRGAESLFWENQAL